MRTRRPLPRVWSATTPLRSGTRGPVCPQQGTAVTAAAPHPGRYGASHMNCRPLGTYDPKTHTVKINLSSPKRRRPTVAEPETEEDLGAAGFFAAALVGQGKSLGWRSRSSSSSPRRYMAPAVLGTVPVREVAAMGLETSLRDPAVAAEACSCQNGPRSPPIAASPSVVCRQAEPRAKRGTAKSFLTADSLFPAARTAGGRVSKELARQLPMGLTPPLMLPSDCGCELGAAAGSWRGGGQTRCKG